MTELRDARFKRALQAAPDAQLGPQEATRRAVRDAAAKAVAPRDGARRWWSWGSASERRMPWDAAFATVLLASLVALLWQDKDVPDARTEASRVDVQAPPPVAPAPAPAPSAAPVPAAPQAAPVPAPTPRPAPAPRQERRAAQTSEALEKSAPQDLARQREARTPLEDSAAGRPASPAADAAAPPAAPESPPPPAPAAAAPAQRAAPAAPRTELSARFQAAPDWHQWSQLRISQDGAAVTVPREQSSQLVDLIERAAAGALTSEPLAAAPQWRVQLSRDGTVLATLELVGDQVRWTAPGAAPRTGRPDPAVLQALREELQRLAPR